MKVSHITKGKTEKIVYLNEVDYRLTDSSVRDFALDAAGETLQSTFGTRVHRPSPHVSLANVTIYTD
jgi:hypothetical protein